MNARGWGLIVLASCGQFSIGGSASTNASPGRPAAPGKTTPTRDAGDAHDTFVVLGVKLGMPVQQDGFTCTKPVDGEDMHCVKFLDKRCAGRETSIGRLRYGEKPPLGCFLDHDSRGTYLDETLQQTPNTGDSSDPRQRNPRKPLASVHVVGTRSTPSKIHRIWYTFAPDDDLADDSKLRGALVAKYGEPSYKNPPGELRWSRDTSKLEAACVRDRQCVIFVDDAKFEAIERRRQEEADARARRQNAPTPQL